MEKTRKNDTPDLCQVGSRLGAVAFSTFSLWLEKVIKKEHKTPNNGYPDPKTVLAKLALSGFWLCLLEFRECPRFSSKNWKTHDLHKTLAGTVQTHHRCMWKILFWPPWQFCWDKLKMSSLYVIVPFGYFLAVFGFF